MKRIRLSAIAIALIFGAAYAAFGFSSPQVWNSPDETAAAFFSKTFAEDGRLWAFDPYNAVAHELVHPRSIISVDAHLAPGSFFGSMWVFGVFVLLLGSAGLALATPIMTAVAGVCVFYLIRRIMDERRALIAELLFFAHPAVWYYASRGLYPNLVFFDLVIIGLSFLLLRPWARVAKGRGSPFLEVAIDDVLGGITLALAFATRGMEFIWLAPLLVAIGWINRRHFTVPRALVVAAGAIAVVAVQLMTNATLYGNATSVGYTAGAQTPGIPTTATSGSRLPEFLSAPRAYVLPFGFHPHLAAVNLWTYAVAFIPWFTILAIVGLITFREKVWKRRLGYSLLWVSVAVGVYYGSGLFEDGANPTWSIGSSYLRYFLPITLTALPFAAHALDWVSARVPRVSPRRVMTVVLGVCVVLSAWTVMFRTSESLVPVLKTLKIYEARKAEVLKLTMSNDVIVVERSDKVFFPDRHVILNLRDPGTLDVLPTLAHFGNIYYYGITIADDEHAAVVRMLEDRKLDLGRVKSFGDETLYAITPRL